MECANFEYALWTELAANVCKGLLGVFEWRMGEVFQGPEQDFTCVVRNIVRWADDGVP